MTKSRRLLVTLLLDLFAALMIAGPPPRGALARESSSSCRRHIPAELWAVVWPERHSLAVVLYGVEGAESTLQAQRRLDRLSICHTDRLSPAADDALIAYMRCEFW
eukprot:SAG22_NODE_6892_length_798_cov_1.324750_1_plen_105_part_10